MNALLDKAAAWPLLAAALCLLAVFQASLYWASLEDPPGDANGRRKRWPLTLPMTLLMTLLPMAMLGLYLSKGNPEALLPADDAKFEASMQDSVRQLAQRLHAAPQDDQGWLMMARSLTTLGRYEEASKAYEQARAIAWEQASLLVSWAEVRLLANQRSFDARTQEIVDRAAALSPTSPDVLLLIALGALDRNDQGAARAALEALRAHYPNGSPDLEAVEAALESLKQGRNPRGASTRDVETR